jgi:2-oxoglutarate ferredoxin oxidoreductase subunit beta
MVDFKEYKSAYENKWCPGCGNFGILQAMKNALAALDIAPEAILIVSGIGQAAKTPHFFKCNAFHGLHGRALPLATGAKIVNHDLTILVNMGDGDCYGEGGNHFLHAIRRNIDLTLLVHDNRVFGLTKGQASPTAETGMKTKAQPFGVILEPFRPLAVALVLGAGFVAQGFPGKDDHLSMLIQEGIKHKGFSLINVLQPCVSFNHINTWDWYNERVYKLEDEDYSVEDSYQAIPKTREWGERIPIGVFYKEEKTSFTEKIPVLEKGPLIKNEFAPGTVRDLFDNMR